MYTEHLMSQISESGTLMHTYHGKLKLVYASLYFSTVPLYTLHTLQEIGVAPFALEAPWTECSVYG